MAEYTQIPLEDLEIGCWYIGRGRGANVGLWNGDCFTTICFYGKSWAEVQAIRSGKRITKDMKNGHEIVKHESYFYKDEASKPTPLDIEGLGSFQPFLKVDFGKIVGEKYDGAYGEKLRVRWSPKTGQCAKL